ncbi:restriction endonuclease subunit S [Desmospora activa]|uniref:Type I restriction enzyme S subunit n=1 Tax=Desmospora activa DSM 45169 TaxID=1121389 RepID=A0A2T4ZCJ8_9BACL|nr:restriction endonuclease subunit S [Desmospora activa]PTM59614.1 type I restriction enzyme S subunit [Desmospora activa DSM 45169]
MIKTVYTWARLIDIAANKKNAIVDGPFGSSLKVSDYVDSGIPVLQGKNITSNKFAWDYIRFISKEKAEELKRSKVIVGDILVVKIGSVGYSAEITDLNGYPFAIIPANLAKVTVDETKVSKKYLLHWLNSPIMTNHLKSIASKTAQPALSLSKIKEIPIPLPPLHIQKQIVQVLDEADALIQKRKQAIAKLDELVQSVFLEMFGDPVKNHFRWHLVEFKELGAWKSGGTPSRKQNHFFKGDIDWYTAGELNEMFLKGSKEKISLEAINHSSAKLFEPGSLLIGMYDTAAFKLGILEKVSSANQACANLTPDTSLLNVIWAYTNFKIMRPYYLSQRRGVRQKNLTLGMIQSFKTPLPPIHLQNQYAKLLMEIQSQKSLKQKQLDKLEENFQSLLQRAYRGELSFSTDQEGDGDAAQRGISGEVSAVEVGS